VVARRRADRFEIVVLATDADALLAGGGALVRALLATREHVLELHHARVGEHQRRIVLRHDGAGLHHLVTVFREEA
jgi:hypothetical protein